MPEVMKFCRVSFFYVGGVVAHMLSALHLDAREKLKSNNVPGVSKKCYHFPKFKFSKVVTFFLDTRYRQSGGFAKGGVKLYRA